MQAYFTHSMYCKRIIDLSKFSRIPFCSKAFLSEANRLKNQLQPKFMFISHLFYHKSAGHLYLYTQGLHINLPVVEVLITFDVLCLLQQLETDGKLNIISLKATNFVAKQETQNCKE